MHSLPQMFLGKCDRGGIVMIRAFALDRCVFGIFVHLSEARYQLSLVLSSGTFTPWLYPNTGRYSDKFLGVFFDQA